METGETWAYRERISDPNSPLIPAEVIQIGPAKSHKVRVRWQGGEYPGLDTWVPKVRLLVLWSDAEAWLRDERLYAIAREASMEAVDSVEHKAAWMAVYAHPIPDGIMLGYHASEGAIVEIADLTAVAEDLGFEPDELLSAPLSFTDRHGTYVAPWAVARRIAMRVADRHAERVLAHVAREEAELRDHATHGYYFRWSRKEAETFVPPERSAERLRQEEPAYALVREWCGAPATEAFNELVALRDENARLRELVLEEVRRLEGQGEAYHARWLRRRLDRRER